MGLTSTPRDQYAELVTALYGDGAWELVSKASTLSPDAQRKKRERTQARVGLASNVVGIAAGTAGLVAASKLPALRKAGATAANAGPVTGRLAPKMKTLSGRRRLVQAGAAGAVGLQGANLAGDFVANRVLARGANEGKPKKPKQVKKSLIPITEGQRKKQAKLVRIGTAAGVAAKEQAKKEIGKSMDFTIRGEISKSNEKRQVFGWASVVELDGKPVVDLQEDYMALETIEKAAYDYVHSSRRGGDMHGKESHVSDLIESFVVTPDKKKELGLPDNMPTGWWVGFQVHDDATWQLVKDGKRPEFSIHGSGSRVDVEI